jgi:rhodanese-related sulfurtransferase
MTGARFIAPSELERLMPMIEKGECVLLDIRSPAEFRSSHIKHATAMPLEELESRVEELDGRKILVIYCRSGKRCLRALPVLASAGHGDVLVLEGGMEHWPGDLINY